MDLENFQKLRVLLNCQRSRDCCNVLEVDNLIFQLTRGKHSIYISGI
jgi:hypothetical protein